MEKAQAITQHATAPLVLTPQKSFLQSSEWEQFQKKLGRKTWRVEEALVVKHDLPFGFSYLYAPRPRLVDEHALRLFLHEAEKIATEDGSIFLKIDRDMFFVPEATHKISHALQPQVTRIVDLSGSSEKLLADMHSKTRYNIRLAQKHGVKTRIANYKIGSFINLLGVTAERDEFKAHPAHHYENLLDPRSTTFSNELFFAEYLGKPVAAALINFYGPSKTATYLHGASSREHREVMAPHLLHWNIIEEAKKRGMAFYDLWGVDEKRWPGVTRFKRGFGGEEISYPETIDIIFRPFLYKIYTQINSIRKRI